METPIELNHSEQRPSLDLRGAAAPLIQRLKTVYSSLGPEMFAEFEALYTTDVEFHDPVHTLYGSLALKHYLRNMATHLLEYRIRYLDEVIGPHAAYLTWEMDYAHRHLKGGRLLTVRGMSQLKFTDKVYYHEDSYDLGALLYEHLPAIGFATRQLKSRMARL
jgi:SnoaL-like domain